MESFAQEQNKTEKYDFLIEINNLEYPPKIINKQIDKIIGVILILITNQ